MYENAFFRKRTQFSSVQVKEENTVFSVPIQEENTFYGAARIVREHFLQEENTVF